MDKSPLPRQADPQVVGEHVVVCDIQPACLFIGIAAEEDRRLADDLET